MAGLLDASGKPLDRMRRQAKVGVHVSFDDIAELIAQGVAAILPARFKFVLIMVAPDGATRLLHNSNAQVARDIVRHCHEDGAKGAKLQGGV